MSRQRLIVSPWQSWKRQFRCIATGKSARIRHALRYAAGLVIDRLQNSYSVKPTGPQFHQASRVSQNIDMANVAPKSQKIDAVRAARKTAHNGRHAHAFEESLGSAHSDWVLTSSGDSSSSVEEATATPSPRPLQQLQVCLVGLYVGIWSFVTVPRATDHTEEAFEP